MRAVVQRVKRCSVLSNGEKCADIAQGLLVLLGVTHEDTQKDCDYLAEKIANLRIFEDDAGKMNRSVKDVGGEIVSVSQFTLYGDCKHGRRPSFTNAAKAEEANLLYEVFNESLRKEGLQVQTGVFQTDMQVELVNDGPVTMLLDSEKII